MQTVTVAFDARPLQPETRHWGPGVFLLSLLARLQGQFSMTGLAQDFAPPCGVPVNAWPSTSKLNTLLFEVSPLLFKSHDIYWGTNHFLPQFLKSPSLVTVHDLLLLNGMDAERGRAFLSWRLRSSLRRAKKVATVSRTTADELTRVLPEIVPKVEIVTNGFERPKEWETANLGADVAPDRPYLVMLGAHRPRKNLELAVAVTECLAEEAMPILLVITGNVHPSLRALVRRAGQKIVTAGVLPKDAVFGILRKATALVFPSRYEGFGFPILEAMAARCPVLALDTAINREIAGNAAILLPPHPRVWAEAIRRLVQHPPGREEWVRRGEENLNRFSWDKAAGAYAELFREVAS